MFSMVYCIILIESIVHTSFNTTFTDEEIFDNIVMNQPVLLCKIPFSTLYMFCAGENLLYGKHIILMSKKMYIPSGEHFLR